MSGLRGWLLLSLAAVAMCDSLSIATAEVLITADEAKLPPPKGTVAVASRGVTRGPKIELVSPAADCKSPIHLQVKFKSYGGAKINLETVRVTYLRSPNVDLTERIKPFLQPTGIDMPNAELPPGDYAMRFDLQDSDGRVSSSMFVWKVSQ